MITNDARCTLEIKSTTVMVKVAFDKKKSPFTRKLDLNLRKKPVKCSTGAHPAPYTLGTGSLSWG
jgi:hypothetical protein